MCVVFDIVGCYDAVQCDISSSCLQCLWCLSKNISLSVKNVFTNCWTRTVINNIGSYWSSSTAGLGQEKTISPILDLLDLESIHHVVTRQQIFKIILFSDDISLCFVLSFNHLNLVRVCYFMQLVKTKYYVVFFRKNKMQFVL